MLARTSELRSREVVSISDGRRLGLISDMEIDVATGEVKAIVVPGPTRFLRILSKDEDIVIPWEKIIKIGVDVILVEAAGFVEPRRGQVI